MADFSANVSGPDHDKVDLPAADFANFDAMLADTTFVNGNAIITSPNGSHDQLTIDNITEATLKKFHSDFTFRS